MKLDMRCAGLALTALGLVAVLTSDATADPIRYTARFTAGTVSLDGSSFTNETVTLSGIGDTSKITSGTNGLANDVTLSVTVGSITDQLKGNYSVMIFDSQNRPFGRTQTGTPALESPQGVCGTPRPRRTYRF